MTDKTFPSATESPAVAGRLDQPVRPVRFLRDELDIRRSFAADARKPCTCDGAGRGPGRACVVKAGGRLGELWRCADGFEA